MTTVLSLEQKVTERVHQSIGDLITEQDLKAVVERGIEKALFQVRTVPDTGYRGWKEVPSLVDTIVENLLRAKMEEAVRQWLEENPVQIQLAIERAMKAGVAQALLDALDCRFQNIFEIGVQNLQNRGLLSR